MIRIDPRRGSGDFRRLIQRLGVTTTHKTLPFADFSFYGNGPAGTVRVGVERKTLSEMITAIEDSRLVGHQLPGLLGSVHGRRRFDYVYLVVEGSYYPDARSGLLMQGRREVGHGATRHLYESLEKFLMTLELHGQIRVRRTNGMIATAYFVTALYRWFQKDWYAHKSAYKVEEDRPERAILEQRTLDRKTYAQWPGVGWVRSARVEQHFACVRDAASAEVREWRKVSWRSRRGKRQSIGPKTAGRLVAWLHGRTPKATGKGR